VDIILELWNLVKRCEIIELILRYCSMNVINCALNLMVPEIKYSLNIIRDNINCNYSALDIVAEREDDDVEIFSTVLNHANIDDYSSIMLFIVYKRLITNNNIKCFQYLHDLLGSKNSTIPSKCRNIWKNHDSLDLFLFFLERGNIIVTDILNYLLISLHKSKNDKIKVIANYYNDGKFVLTKNQKIMLTRKFLAKGESELLQCFHF
jgi:hypothetical protein